MTRQNLHCHTLYDDGNDSPEAMVFAALRAGLSSVGISLHCPLEGEDAWCCSDEEEPIFISEIHRLHDLFEGHMDIWCGLEYDVDAARRTVPPYDYIIGSCHMLNGISVDNDPDTAAHLIAYHGGQTKAAQLYYERLTSMAELPEISIVGHFDLLTKFDERESLYDTTRPAYRDAAFAAMEALNRAGKIFEINAGAICSGWRARPYPSEELLRHLQSLGGRVCISSDAHCAKDMIRGFDLCEELARSCGFTEVWHFTGDGFRPVGL